MEPIIVWKGRTVVVPVSLGYDVSGDTFASEIRKEKTFTSDLIATWEVTFLTDGQDGELILTLDDAVTGPIPNSTGYMDLKRTTDGEPVPVFDQVLEVLFKDSVTA